MDVYQPRDEADVLAVVEAAVAAHTALEVLGHGSKRGLGRPVEAAATLDLSGLSGVTLYEPSELVLRARPGTPMTEIAALLDEHEQELAFEPMDPTRLWRGNRSGTIGGTVAVNAGGPRRIKAGAARDHLLGFRAVSGRGDIFKSGGRVVKNVTGYDLSKLIAGSYGTLAVLTEVTLKVLPRAETERTLLVYARDEATCLALLREASGLPQEVSSFACLPEGAWLDLPPGPCALLRLEGPGISVNKRFADLVTRFGPAGRTDDLGSDLSRRAWSALRDVVPLADEGGPVWKVSLAPTHGFEFVARLRQAGLAPSRWYYDWAGGLVWLALADGASRHEAVRAALAPLGGHATLMRAGDVQRTTTPVFQPQPPALAALTRRVKASFDPLNILNRGRLGLED